MNLVPESHRLPEGFYEWRNTALVSLLHLSFHSTQDGEDNATEKYLLSEGEVALQEAEKDGK